LASQDHQSISYLTFIDQSISAFDKSSYRLSEEKFSVILGQYPDDVNALFYGGLSSYQLGNYDQAIVWFNEILQQSISTFHEEAEFYLAMSHKASKGGFYAQKASEEITE
jgi:tetratricopeptide (TPR) repeat protein